MYYRYELFICHSNKTWSDCHFIDVTEENVHEWDGNMDAMAIGMFMAENPKIDIVHIGVSHVESISAEDYDNGENDDDDEPMPEPPKAKYRQDPTWEDLDEMIQLKDDEDDPISLQSLEGMDFQSIEAKEIVAALAGRDSCYSVALAPFDGMRLTIPTQVARMRRCRDQDQLLYTLWTAGYCKLLEKKKKASENRF